MTNPLLSLKASQLKRIATQCGLISSGNKAELSRRLSGVISSPSLHSDTPVRILSIDMGIRNLAYSVLSVPKIRDAPCTPSVEVWRRISLPRADPELSETGDSLPSGIPPKESFHPAVYASHAYTLLSETLLPLQPTHILIERQRWRSSGGPTVQEWTLRVNMLEAMLHAVLRTLREEGSLRAEVIAVSPARVAQLWLGDGVGSSAEGRTVMRDVGSSQGRSGTNKIAKVDVVGGWLRDGSQVSFGQREAEVTRTAFLSRWDRKARRKGPSRANDAVGDADDDAADTQSAFKKLDDLSDALLQGVAYIRWEESKAMLKRLGIEAFL